MVFGWFVAIFVFRGICLHVVNNCWHAAARQVEYGGAYHTSLDLANDRVNMSGLASQKDLKIDVQKGVDLVIKNLNEGKSVVAGLNYGTNAAAGISGYC